MTTTQKTLTLRIFEDQTGWFFAKDESPLDTRGERFGSACEAMAGAIRYGEFLEGLDPDLTVKLSGVVR